MTDVLEVVLELEWLAADLALHPLKADSSAQLLILLRKLADLMGTTLSATISKECLAHQEAIINGDMT